MTNQTENHLSEALHDLVGNQPFHPDTEAIERRGRRMRRNAVLLRGGTSVGVVAAIAAVSLGVSGTSSPTKVPAHVAGGTTAVVAGSPLTTLADAVLASDSKLSGDATLVVRSQHPSNGPASVGDDLYGDDGTYYYADTAAGLPALVAGHQNMANGVFGREQAIAVDAAKGGDLAADRVRMENAAYDGGKAPSAASQASAKAAMQAIVKQKIAAGAPSPIPLPAATLTSDRVWSNAYDALVSGAGKPEVRAGVLRLLAGLPTVSVTNTTTGGKPTLTVTNDDGQYAETLVIGAKDGIPVSFHGGNTDGETSTAVTYQVSRVTLSDVSAGKI